MRREGPDENQILLSSVLNRDKKIFKGRWAWVKTVNILNKRAKFDYEIIETYTAGIVLTGTEIKSIHISVKMS